MSTIHVSNISHTTTEQELSSFFSFCGKITTLSLTPVSGEPSAPKSATITFERDSAAKTAALLDGTPLNNTPLKVELAHSIDEIAGSASPPRTSDTDDIPQEDKPRTAIFAEYLAQGYTIGDNVLQKAIELDRKQGISARFTSLLNNTLTMLEEKTHATERAQTIDNQYHITEKAQNTTSGVTAMLSRYFEIAMGTVPGQRIRAFYEGTEKQLQDIHNEAKRLAEMRKEQSKQKDTFGESADGKPHEEGKKQTCGCGGDEGACKCEGGKCACAGCDVGKTAEEKAGTTGQLEHAVTDIKGAAQDYSVPQ